MFSRLAGHTGVTKEVDILKVWCFSCLLFPCSANVAFDFCFWLSSDHICFICSFPFTTLPSLCFHHQSADRNLSGSIVPVLIYSFNLCFCFFIPRLSDFILFFLWFLIHLNFSSSLLTLILLGFYIPTIC